MNVLSLINELMNSPWAGPEYVCLSHCVLCGMSMPSSSSASEGAADCQEAEEGIGLKESCWQSLFVVE